MALTPLTTDLYELTMMAGYVNAGRHRARATFELFVRRMPPNRSCLIAAGLEPALDYIEGLHFTPEDIAWIQALPVFAGVGAPFFDYLRGFRFTGDIWAVREGTPFFANEPILRVTAPLAEAQLLETALLAIVNFQTSIASKAHRVVQAGAGHPVMEFGARRAHGIDAAIYAARAASIGGCAGTSLVEAGRRFGIPVSGTMAHSWVLAAPSELEAFTTFTAMYGRDTVLLLDTYDVAAAAAIVARSGLRPAAVRIDSGDLLALARMVREVLDRGGLAETRILVSGDLDEWKIRDLVAAGAPIDGFAVGTALTTSEDAPALGGVYKLVEIEEDGQVRQVMKRSTGKKTWPGRKQVWRMVEDGRAVGDLIGLEAEPSPLDGPGFAPDAEHPAGAIALLEPVVRGGVRLSPPPSLTDTRAYRAEMIALLPPGFSRLDDPPDYPVDRTEALQQLIDAAGVIG
ncbi:MAG: nicotinate phosphoribosyltransferase [Acidobacteriota bacterium]